MRGGLGRTLLTAFLILSILPLGVISFLAATQARGNLQHEIEEKLVVIAALTESQLYDWLSNQQNLLTALASSLSYSLSGANRSLTDVGNPSSSASAQSMNRRPPPLTTQTEKALLTTFVEQILSYNPISHVWLLVDQKGNIQASHPSITASEAYPELVQERRVFLGADSPLLRASAPVMPNTPLLAMALAEPIAETGLFLVTLLDLDLLSNSLETSDLRTEGVSAYLVPPVGHAFKLNPGHADTESTQVGERSDGVAGGESALSQTVIAERSLVQSYDNHLGVPVVGAYRKLPDLGFVLLVEQARDSALASSDELAVVLIAATLAAVLLTALIAAAVTRRITLPIVHLTATAVQIASGDLSQKVPATRRDEIGILARAFNVMTSKLRILYEDLEQKVRERTQELREANAKIRYRAMQLAISAEVGRVVTSILDRDLLLSRVVELIRDCFEADSVAVYLLDDSGQWTVFQDGSREVGERLRAQSHGAQLDQDSLVSRAASRLSPCVRTGSSLDSDVDRKLFPHTRAELAVPLRIGQRMIGVLDVHSTHEDAFDEDEIMVLETLSGQISVAIENARVYELERRAADELRDWEELRRSFLSNMSRELRMPLNNIIGFSRVMLKGIDGPITDLQREDLNAIHDSGQQLLVLINDILDIAQIEAGAMELDIRPTNLAEIARSVVPTVSALLEGRSIDFSCEISPNLPLVLADPHRVRQVLIKLLSNAAKFTHQGKIILRVWPDGGQILTSVLDTGMGIPARDRDKVFGMFRQLSQPSGRNKNGAGLGLSFSKEIVEMHGGSIWLESQEGEGTVFTFSLPICEPGESSQ